MCCSAVPYTNTASTALRTWLDKSEGVWLRHAGVKVARRVPPFCCTGRGGRQGGRRELQRWLQPWRPSASSPSPSPLLFFLPSAPPPAPCCLTPLALGLRRAWVAARRRASVDLAPGHRVSVAGGGRVQGGCRVGFASRSAWRTNGFAMAVTLQLLSSAASY